MKWLYLKKRKIILLFCAATALSLLGIYSYHKVYTPQIYSFSYKRDHQFVLNIFEKNWYWLVSEYSKDFSPEYMLQNKASSKQPEHRNNLTIKTIYLWNEPLGFVAYYKKSFYLGFVLFLAVQEKYRNKGYAYLLLSSAIEDIKRQGCTKVKLITRTSNESAQKLYKRFGFKEINNDEEFVNFEYYIQ